VVTDETGRVVLGAERFYERQGPGSQLLADGKIVGHVWLVAKKNSIGELARNYFYIPLLIRNFLTALVSSALALGIAFMLSDYLARHIGDLALAARSITGGNLAHRMRTSGRDELGELAADFNKMAEKLQEDQRLRQQLQADVVHELRTPLAVCQAVLDSLDSKVIPWDDKALASLQEETSRMNRLVTDLHELNRADNNQLPLYKELFAVSDLLERLEESFAGLARQKNIGFSIDSAEDAPDAIFYADPDRVMQIFLNILHNALRHTADGGSITLRVGPQNGNMMPIAVADTGNGIPVELLPHIFERFFSGDRSRSRQRSGTGLGLAIAREYALVHGGDIKVKSLPGQGTEFIVTLPVEAEPV
jgi:two-component system sensor histidine kinase BaeS